MEDKFIYNIMELINVIVENLIMILFYHRIFQKKFQSHVPYISIYTGVFFVLSAVTLLIVSPLARVAITFIVLFFICIFLYHGSVILKLFVCVYWVVIVFVSDLLLISVLVLMGYGNPIQLLEPGTGRLLGMIGTKIFAFWIVVYTSRIYKNKVKSLPLKYWILILMMPFFSVVIIKLVFVANETDKSVMGSYVICVGGILYLNLLVFDYFESYDKQIRLAALEKIAEKEKENYKLLAASYKEIRDIKHDLKDQVELLNNLIEKGDYKEAQNHMHRLYNTVESATSVCYTGNSAVDSIINLKGVYARNNNIRFKTKIKVSQIEFDIVGLCRILGNIMDNAIEACERINSGKRYIFFMMNQTENKLIIEVSNTSPEVDINNLSTSKENKLIHGIGLKSIKQTAHSMNGYVSYSYVDGFFNMKVVLVK